MDREEAAKIVSEDCMEYLDNIVEMLNAPYFVEGGMKAVSISRNKVVIEKHCAPGDRNSNGFIHGGALYGAMDHCHAILVNISGHAVGQSANVNYFRPARADVLRFEAETENESRSFHYSSVKAYEGDKLLVSGTFCAFKLQEVHK